MAATLTDELTRVTFADIAKWEEGPDGTLYVYGRATSPDLDTDEQVVSPAWSGASLKQWLAEAPALRVQHNPQRDPAGSGVKVEVDRDGDNAHWVKAAVDEPIAQRLVKKGHLRAFSIGIAKPVIERDVTGKARGGIITGGKIVEVSLVDSPANRSCFFELAKADKTGAAEFTGKVFGADSLIAKAATEDAPIMNVDVPKSATLMFSPADLAKLLEHRRVAEQRQAETAQSAKFAAETAVYKRDIDTATRRRLAARGRALPNLSYPIENHEDAENAVTLALSGHGNVSAAKKLIRRIARKEGWQDILDRLGGKKKEKGVDTAPGAVTEADTGKTEEPAPPAEAAVPEIAKDDGGDAHEPVLHHDDGEDDDTDSDADAMDKAAAPEVVKPPKAACPSCGKKTKAGRKFCPSCGKPMTAQKASRPTPDGGATGAAESAIQPAPEHREPDGPAVEALEHDAHLPTVPDASVKTALRLRELGVPAESGRLHDLLCPAYADAAVKAAWPGADVSQVDEMTWQAKALEIAATAPLEQAQQAARVWESARSLKAVTPDLYDDIMAETRKAFRDANPGPGKAPEPGEMSAQRYNRPLITAGHAAPSPDQDASNKAPIHPGHISAADYTRPLITAGHAADSPDNAPGHPIPMGAPEIPGVPSRVFYTNVQRQNARQAMQSMHDHIAMTFPDLCPMHGPGHAGEQPSHARPVAVGVGGPAPHGASTKADGPAAAKAAKKAAKKERRRRQMAELIGKNVWTREEAETWAAKAFGLPPGDSIAKAVPGELVTPGAANPVTPDVIKAAVTEATAPLLARLDEQDKMLNAIASQPDPNVTAYRGPVMGAVKSSAAPAGPLSVPQRAAHAQDTAYRAMYDQWRNSPDPGLREQALTYLMGASGLIPAPPA